MTQNWRCETDVIRTDDQTHEQVHYHETTCGVCSRYIHETQPGVWVHHNGSELCHERAA